MPALPPRVAVLLLALVSPVARGPSGWGDGPDPWFDTNTTEREVLSLTNRRLDEGVDVNTVWIDTPYGQDGITWLQSAAAQGYEDVVELLLSRGANASMENEWGWNALHFAAAGGSEPICRMLVTAGLDPRQPCQ